MTNILEEIRRWIGLQSAPVMRQQGTSGLREAVEAGQRAKRAENYLEAMDALNRGMQLAISAADSTAIAVIAMNQAEVLMALEKWEDARYLLETTHQAAQQSRQKTQSAYLLSAMGTLAQVQGDWSEAQRYYEEALEMARASRSAGAEGWAMGFLADTYLHDSNASYAIHLLREALPKLNMTGDIEVSSYFVGRLGEALIASGHTAEGHQLIERALRLAKQMNYRRYERQWGLVLGARALADGRYDDAYAHFKDILGLFHPERHAAGYIDALCQMSRACLSLVKHDEALQYARQAAALSEGASDPVTATRTRAALGMALAGARDYAGAIPHLEAATGNGGQMDGALAGFSEVTALRTLAMAYAEAGDDDHAAQTYQRAAQRAEQQGERLEAAQAHRDLGLHYSRRRRIPDAIREWTTALGIYEAERQFSQVARLHCDIAAARRYLGQGQRAMKEYEEALMILSSISDDWETRGLVLANAATAYVDQGDLESADSFFNEAIAIARRTGNETAEATRRGNYGWFLLSTGRPQQAISTLEYSLRLSKTLGLKLQSAIQTDNLGLAYDVLSQYPKALDYHRQAAGMLNGLNSPHWLRMFQLNEAYTLLALNDAESAQPLLETALAQGRADEDIEATIRALTGLARAEMRRSETAQAEGRLDEATALARRADMRRLLAEALSAASELRAAREQTAEAQALWDEALKLFKMLHSPQAKLQPAWLKEVVSGS